MDRTVRIPKRINPCPILEALLEVRFDANFGDALHGMFYGAARGDIRAMMPLPSNQIPDVIRENDPVLKYQPTHRLEIDDHYAIQIGPHVFSLSSVNGYPGWENYSVTIKKFLGLFFDMGVQVNINRIGLRYISFFNNNVFNNIKLKISLGDFTLEENEIQHKSMHANGDIRTNLSIVNNAIVNIKDSTRRGSVIDIDAFWDQSVQRADVYPVVDRLHEEERIVFYNLPTDEFLATFNPEY